MQKAAMLEPYIKSKGSVRNIRFNIIRSLKDTTVSITTNFKQIL